jgi:hypothetical protein
MEERKMKKLIAAMVALAMLAAISTTALAADVPSGTPSDVKTTTSQTDTYMVTLTWGDMTFAYDFGTWNTTTHQWTGETWVTAGFNGTKDMITVANNSSQPVDAAFAYLANAAAGTNNGNATTGTFTKETGNVNDKTVAPTTGPTGIMALDLCSVGAVGGVPTAATFLNLQGRPAASIGATAAKIGTITVTLSASLTGATTELAKVTDAAVTTVPNGTENTKVTIEAAMIAKAQAVVATGYTVTIAEGSTYDLGTNAWAGKFTVTNNNNVTNTKTDAANRAITVVIAAA